MSKENIEVEVTYKGRTVTATLQTLQKFRRLLKKRRTK